MGHALAKESAAHEATRRELAVAQEAFEGTMKQVQQDHEATCKALEDASSQTFAAMIRERHQFRDLQLALSPMPLHGGMPGGEDEAPRTPLPVTLGGTHDA